MEPQTPAPNSQALSKPLRISTFKEMCEHTKKDHQKHDHGNLQLCFENQRNINDLMPPQDPSGPFQTLGLAILQRTCNMFQKAITQ